MGIGGKRKTMDVLCDQLAALLTQQKLSRAKYRKVFEADAELEARIEGVKARIKKDLQEAYTGSVGRKTVYRGDDLIIEVTPRNERVFDVAGFLHQYRDQLVEIGAVVQVPAKPAYEDIDIAAVDAAVHRKAISKELVSQFVSQGAAKTPAVAFKLPAPEEEK